MSGPSPSDLILRAAASAAGVTVAEMVGYSRRQEMVHARWAVMVALRARNWSTPRIGRKLGGRDHTTVLVGLRRARELRECDDDFAWLCGQVMAS